MLSQLQPASSSTSWSPNRRKSRQSSSEATGVLRTWIFRHGTLDFDTLEDDVASLRRFYEHKGFFDARVGRKLIWSPDNSEVQVNFVVDEGARYTVDRVSFKGNASLSESQLRSHLK